MGQGQARGGEVTLRRGYPCRGARGSPPQAELRWCQAGPSGRQPGSLISDNFSFEFSTRAA